MINLSIGKDGYMEPFKTPNHTYRCIPPGDPIGILRWTAYEKLAITTGTNRTFQQLVESDTKLIELLGSDKPLAEIRVEAILTLDSRRRAILDESTARYNKAFYLATVFLMREDHNLRDWSMETAEEYIKDWEQSEVSNNDLFFFAMTKLRGLSDALKSIRGEKAAEIIQTMERL